MSTTFESDWENTRLKEQLAAKDDEIRELVTSDNKVVADLSRYVETLEQKIADKNDAYRAACAVVAKMHEAAIGEVVGPVLGVVEVVANVREQLIEAQKQIVMLREELATTQSELETERRLSFRNQVAELERELFAARRQVVELSAEVERKMSAASFLLSERNEQLAATDGLDQYILCEKEPVVWMQSDHLSRFVHHACGAQSALVRCSDHQLMPDFQPLYRAKEPKP